MDLVFATNNQHKLDEISNVLNGSFSIHSLKVINCTEDIPETGTTLEANASQKSRCIFERYNINCFADDTGLEVPVLNGAPGVYSARYAGEERCAEKNMEKVLRELQGKTERGAQFRTVISLFIDGDEFLFEGIVKGQIIKEKRGSKGFGYDPIFIPDGYDETFAEMDMAMKNRISHRAKAVEKLSEFLKTLSK